MRENSPEIFDRMSCIVFDPFSTGVTHTCFDMLARDHGSDDSYSWSEGGGKYRYSVKRREELGYSDGWPINAWDLVVEEANGNTVMLMVDCINSRVADAQGNQATNEQLNLVFRAAVDARAEREHRDRAIPFFTLGGKHIFNVDYDPNSIGD